MFILGLDSFATLQDPGNPRIREGPIIDTSFRIREKISTWAVERTKAFERRHVEDKCSWLAASQMRLKLVGSVG
jgi:hypothetical protein